MRLDLNRVVLPCVLVLVAVCSVSSCKSDATLSARDSGGFTSTPCTTSADCPEEEGTKCWSVGYCIPAPAPCENGMCAPGFECVDVTTHCPDCATPGCMSQPGGENDGGTASDGSTTTAGDARGGSA